MYSFFPSNAVLVVDNAAGHSYAEKLQEELERKEQKEKEDAWLERYCHAMEDNEDDSDIDDDSDNDDNEEEDGSEQAYISASWRWRGTKMAPTPSHQACCKRPERKVSEQSVTLDLSDDQKQSLLNLYQKSLLTTATTAKKATESRSYDTPINRLRALVG